MKEVIKKLLRKELNESINLNLTKQLRKKQLSYDNNDDLENLFGKNIYRLYYDLETGKQIFPQSNRDTKLKFDVPIVDKLKKSIESVLNDLDYSLIDFEKNIAKNNKTNQQIKISKVINDTDFELQKNYSEFLGALTKKHVGGEKLLVVISRHSHDIGSMSAKPQISSCEDISEFTNIRQIPNPDGSNPEGSGVGILGAIEAGDLVFYLIKENDLNIQDPISRFLEGRICEFGNSSHFYGKFDNNFKNFINIWLRPYRKLKGLSDNEFEDNFYLKSVEEIHKAIYNIIYDNSTQSYSVIKNLISNKRFDVIYDLMCESEWKRPDDNEPMVETRVLSEQNINYILSVLNNIYGYKMFNILPDNLKNIFFDKIKERLNKKLNDINKIYEILFLDFDKTDLVKKIKANPEHRETFQSYLDKNKLKFDNTNSAESLIKYGIPFGNLAKFVDVDLYNKLNQYRTKFKEMSSDVREKITDYYNKLFSMLA
jgi:hypothetical protein